MNKTSRSVENFQRDNDWVDGHETALLEPCTSHIACPHFLVILSAIASCICMYLLCTVNAQRVLRRDCQNTKSNNDTEFRLLN